MIGSMYVHNNVYFQFISRSDASADDANTSLESAASHVAADISKLSLHSGGGDGGHLTSSDGDDTRLHPDKPSAGGDAPPKDDAVDVGGSVSAKDDMSSERDTSGELNASDLPDTSNQDDASVLSNRTASQQEDRSAAEDNTSQADSTDERVLAALGTVPAAMDHLSESRADFDDLSVQDRKSNSPPTDQRVNKDADDVS